MRTSRLVRSGIALLGLVIVAMVLWGQGTPLSHNRIPLAEDWSHRHLIYSSPTSAQRDYQVKQQYRYWHQLFQRNARVQMPAVDKASLQFAPPQSQEDRKGFSGVPNRNDGDSGGNPIAAGSSTVVTMATTARSAMSAASSRQQRPWTIYGLRLLLAVLFLLSLALGIKETQRRRLAFSLALGLMAGFLALQIGCAVGERASTPLPVTAQSLQRDWASSLTANGTVGEGMFPAKFTFDVTAAPSCANDFVVFTTSLSSGATTVDIIAYNNLYSGTGGICAGPSVLWAYQTTSAAGKTVTSPVLSRDGTQVAYVEGTGGTGVLHILRPGTGANAGTLAAPVPPSASTTGAAYNTCKSTASNACVLNLAFANGLDDSFSSPFYDYDDDMLFVGDNGGNLHEFTGVFNGVASEAGAPWPITVNSTHPLTGPVEDDTSGNIFVNDVDGSLWYVRQTAGSSGTCGVGTPPCLGSTNVLLSNFLPSPPPRQSITDPPIVDSTQGRVFAFTGHASAAGLRGANVFQADTALSAASVIDLDVGQGDSWTLHSGFFDNAYFTSVATGHLYICANSGALGGSGSGFDVDNHPTLRRITFNAGGTMNAVDAGSLALTTLTSACSPITEIRNGATDRMFMSVQANGAPAGCGGNGCVMSVSVPTASPFTFPAALSGSLPEPGGASGIVIDNVSASGQASSLYFSILANSTGGLTCGGISGVGCAVKVTQSGLN